MFAEPHNLWATEKDEVFIADRADHTVRKFTVDGELLMTLGTPHIPGRPGMPFNGPAKAVCSRAGDIFVADGYNQTRIHRFSENGEFLARISDRRAHTMCVDPEGSVYATHGHTVDDTMLLKYKRMK